eukprot:4384592-Amphidinium_carterae.1
MIVHSLLDWGTESIATNGARGKFFSHLSRSIPSEPSLGPGNIAAGARRWLFVMSCRHRCVEFLWPVHIVRCFAECNSWTPPQSHIMSESDDTICTRALYMTQTTRDNGIITPFCPQGALASYKW